MKVLLLGAGGMLGKAQQEVWSDVEVVAYDKNELDITKEGEVMQAFKSLQPHLVINTAAYTNVDGAQTDKETAFAVNGEAVRNIAKAVKAVGSVLVHYSTDYVFSGENPEGYSEDAVPGDAVNVYGLSKLAGEQALAEEDPLYYLIRTAWLYGEGGRNFVDTMLRLAKDHPTLSVINDQYGNPTYTLDLAKATRQLLAEKYSPGIYHMTNSGTTTWYEFASEIFRQAKKSVVVAPVTTQEYPLPARRPRFSMLLNTKAPALRPWPEALQEYLGSKVMEESKGNDVV